MSEERMLVQFNAARRALEAANSIDEIKRVRDQAEALRLYVKQQGESHEMQNDIAEIKLRAERRAGELLREMDRAQGKRDNGTSYQDGTKSFEQALAEHDIAKMTAYRWQTEAAIPEPAFEQYIAEQKSDGQELTSAGLYRLGRQLRNNGKPHVSHSSGNNEWYTPPEFIEAARLTMGDIDLDPASSDKANEIVQAQAYYTAEDDGLSHSWRGRVWMNPPYASNLIGEFCRRLQRYVMNERITEACVLVNNATETGWFNALLSVASAICLVRGRVKFIDADGNPSGSPLQGQVVLYVGPNVARFASAFGQFGAMLYVD
jgi:phage N-6-adenine-methyltransferase